MCLPSPAARTASLVVTLLFVLSPRAEAIPIGTFDESIHDHVEIRFQFPATAAGDPLFLSLGLPSSFVPPSPSYQGCEFDLYGGGNLISSRSINSVFGCQGNWTSGDGSGVSGLIDTLVDLSSIAAGQEGRILMRPTFLGPGGVANLDNPGISFSGTGAVTILSQSIVPIPEPSTAMLLLTGLGLIAGRRRVASS